VKGNIGLFSLEPQKTSDTMAFKLHDINVTVDIGVSVVNTRKNRELVAAHAVAAVFMSSFRTKMTLENDPTTGIPGSLVIPPGSCVLAE